MLNYLIDALFTQPYDPLGPHDVRIHPAVRDHSPLDFSTGAVAALIDDGYADARRALAGCAPVAPPAGAIPTPTSPDEGFIRDRLARLAEEGVYESVWLRPRTAAVTVAGDSAGRLAFAPVATLAPERLILGGLAYDAHDGASAWFGSAHLAPAGGRLVAGGGVAASAWRQDLVLDLALLRRHPLPRRGSGAEENDLAVDQLRLPDPRSEAPPWSTLVRRVMRPDLTITASREIVRLYDEDGMSLDRPSTHDLLAFVGVSGTPATSWRLALGPALHLWSIHSAALADDAGAHAYGVIARAARLASPPPGAPDLNTVPALAAEALWFDQYRRASAQLEMRGQAGRFILRPRAAAGWGESLPLSAQFPLGGARGFPGLRTGERRGDRFAYASVAVLHPVAGPVYFRGEVGSGTTSYDDTRLPLVVAGAASGWVHGAEVGFAMGTLLGPLHVGYGAASNGRPVFKIQLGG